MPARRAASSRLDPSSTNAIAKSRPACSGVEAAFANFRTSAAVRSVRTATVIRTSPASAATDSTAQQNGEITNESATWTLGITGPRSRTRDASGAGQAEEVSRRRLPTAPPSGLTLSLGTRRFLLPR